MGRASESVESNEVHAFAINRTADRRLTSHVDIVRRSNILFFGSSHRRYAASRHIHRMVETEVVLVVLQLVILLSYSGRYL